MAYALLSLAMVANHYWWRFALTHMETAAVHRHPPGSVFPAHVDRLPTYPARAQNVVAMVRPAERGGRLFLDLGGRRVEPDLAPGDVAVLDSGVLHGVTEVEEGERIVVVGHTHMTPR